MRLTLLFASFWLVSVALAGLPVVRQTGTGTAVLAGTVMSDETPSRPIRRATVTISGDVGMLGGRLAVTDDAGRFLFSQLPAGRYLVSASKPAYLKTAFGASRPMRPGVDLTGTAIALGEGQRLTDIAMRMARGSVVTGTVRDPGGKPVRGIVVSVFYYRRAAPAGELALTPFVLDGGYERTDSRGVYRIYGIPPGSYVVVASAAATVNSNLEPTSDADVRRAADRTAAGSPATPPHRPAAGYVPVFYPGTAVAANATIVSLAPEEERSGVDIQMQLVTNARVEGTIVGPDGRPVAGASPRLTSRAPSVGFLDTGVVTGPFTTSDANGHFSIRGVPPGSYSLVVRSVPAAGAGVAAAPPAWATSDVTVLGDDVNVTVALQPGVTVSGRVAFDATSIAVPKDLARVRVSLRADQGGLPGFSPFGVTDAAGRFIMSGVPPGRYRAVVSAPGNPTILASWTLTSATMNGQDALDRGAEIRPGEDVADAVVTLSDRTTEISGAMIDAAGTPAPEYFILAFPADGALWTWQSRRIQQTRPARDGKFTLRGLPAGEYLVGAVTDVDRDECFDPEFLKLLVPTAFKIALKDGEKKVQNIQVR